MYVIALKFQQKHWNICRHIHNRASKKKKKPWCWNETSE